MGIDLSRMEADLAQWARQEDEQRNARVTIVASCRSLDDAGIGPNLWTAESAIAFARVLIRPGDADSTPAQALATLEKLADVPNRDKALQALQFERATMRRLVTMTVAYGEQRGAIEEVAQAKRDARKRYRTRNNLTQGIRA